MEHYGFFNGGDEYGQEEFNRYFDNLYESGIAVNEDNSMQYPVTAGDGQISVGIGFSILKGFFHFNDSEKTFPLSSDANLPKIYRIIIQLNIPLGKTQLVVRSGTAASTPQPPPLTRTDAIYELSLGQYRIDASGIVTRVKDERSDVTVCGAIRPKNLNEYDQAMKEYTKRFEEWFNAQQSRGWRNVYIQMEEPEGAVSGSIWMAGLT